MLLKLIQNFNLAENFYTMNRIRIIAIVAISLLISINYGFSQVKMADNDVELFMIKFHENDRLQIVECVSVEYGYLVITREPIRGPGGWYYYIEKYDHEFKLISSKNITEQFEKEDFILEKLLAVDGKYIVISYKYSKLSKTLIIYGQELDIESTKLTEPIELYQEQSEKWNGTVNFEVMTSPNKDFFLLSVNPTTRKTGEALSFLAFDKELNKLWESLDYMINEGEKVFTTFEVAFGNEGQVFLLTMTRPATIKGASAKYSSDKYELTIINDGSVEEKIKLESGVEREIMNMSVVMLESGEVYAGGYYRKVDKGHGLDGEVLFEIDSKTNDIKEERWHEFSKEFITSELSERQLKKANAKESKGRDLGLIDLFLRDIIKHDDGTISMVGEIFWITTTTTTNANGSTSTRTTYHYGDLIISRVNGGDFINARYLRHNTYDGATAYFNAKNELILVELGQLLDAYDGDYDVLDRKVKKSLKTRAIVQTTVDAAGEQTVEAAVNFADPKKDGLAVDRQIVKVATVNVNEFANELIIRGRIGKVVQLIRIKY